MTTPFSLNHSTQVAENSILDLNGKQTYLGNSFSLPTLATTFTAATERALTYLNNPSTSGIGMFIFGRKLASSGTTLLKYYLNPTLTNNGGGLTPVNLRPAYGTASRSHCYLYPTASAAVAQVTKLSAFGAGSTYDVVGPAKAVQLFNNGLGYYFYITVSDGSNVQTDPLLVGTGTAVSVASADAANAVATAVYTAIAAVTAAFTATNSPAGTVNVTNVTAGALPTPDSLYLAPCLLSITTAGANFGAGTFLEIVSSVTQIESLSSRLIVIDPGYSLLITGTCASASGGSPINVYTQTEWYEI